MKNFLRSLFPGLHYTTYGSNGKWYYCIWISWLSKCFNVETFEIKQPIN